MKREKDLYIGYLPGMPRRYYTSVRNAILTITAIVLISALVIALYQRKFNNGQFEFGQLTDVSGVLSIRPFPMLTISDRISIMLVGFGKMGAEGTIEHMENEQGTFLDNRQVTLRGTLIYGEGKVLMELTEGEKALVALSDAGLIGATSPEEPGALISVQGEIIDPKCYFGVMKPAQGKVHRSCAIRCVSGGIPPVIRVSGTNGTPEFYILEGEGGGRVNADVLSSIGDQITISGRPYRINRDWQVLRINPAGIRAD